MKTLRHYVISIRHTYASYAIIAISHYCRYYCHYLFHAWPYYHYHCITDYHYYCHAFHYATHIGLLIHILILLHYHGITPHYCLSRLMILILLRHTRILRHIIAIITGHYASHYAIIIVITPCHYVVIATYYAITTLLRHCHWCLLLFSLLRFIITGITTQIRLWLMSSSLRRHYCYAIRFHCHLIIRWYAIDYVIIFHYAITLITTVGATYASLLLILLLAIIAIISHCHITLRHYTWLLLLLLSYYIRHYFHYAISMMSHLLIVAISHYMSYYYYCYIPLPLRYTE